MSSSLDSLLRPFEHKSLKLRNRVAMAPMTRTFSPGYVPNDQVVGYYQRRAEGEVGLIITEGTFVGHKAANGYERVPAIYGDKKRGLQWQSPSQWPFPQYSLEHSLNNKQNQRIPSRAVNSIWLRNKTLFGFLMQPF